MVGVAMTKSFYVATIRVEMDKSLVERLLRRMKVKSLGDYLNHKLLQDIEQLL